MEEKKSKAKKKAYSDYPQLQFTTTLEIRDKVLHRISKIRNHYNKNRDEKSIMFSKSDVAIKALEIGLQELEKNIKKDK